MNKIKEIKNRLTFGGDVCELYLYEEIPEMDEYAYMNTPFWLLDELNQKTNVKQLNLYINSNGGSVRTGFNLINLIQRMKEERGLSVCVYLDGVAFSMASVLAIAVADELVLYENSLLMMHFCSGFVGGNREDLRSVAEYFEETDERLKAVYMSRASELLTAEKLEAMMKAETYLTPSEVMELFDIPTTLKTYINIKALKTADEYGKTPVEKLEFLIRERLEQAEAIEEAERFLARFL